MPVPSPATHRPGVTRRVVVAAVPAALGAGLAGCTPDPVTRGSQRSTSGPGAGADEETDPDVTLAALALADETKVLEAVEATAARHRRLERLLRPVVQAHSAHVTLLEDAAPPEDESSAPDADPSDSASASPEPDGPVRVPRDVDAALERLARLEQRLTTSGKRHAFSARSGAFARVLASMAASSAQHATVLAAARNGPGRR